MKHDYKKALEEIESCLSDEHDGSGYLWDAMTGEHGETITRALRCMVALQVEPPQGDSRSRLCRYLNLNPDEQHAEFVWHSFKMWIEKEVE